MDLSLWHFVAATLAAPQVGAFCPFAPCLLRRRFLGRSALGLIDGSRSLRGRSKRQTECSVYERRGEGILGKAKVAIDRALEHRNDAFRAKVLEMTLKNQWGVDDPAFLILLSTGEMRVLMEEHPAQFEALMNRVFTRLGKLRAEKKVR